MNNIGSSLDSTLRSRAQDLHANSAQLEKQQKDLVRETAGLRKETEKLKKVVDEGARRVKELGNVQNWAEMLERDFLVLEETMRLVRLGDREAGWETSSGSESFTGSDSEEDGGVRVDTMEGGKDMSVTSGLREHQRATDAEGNTTMEGVEGQSGREKKKGKEVEVEQPTATTGSRAASNPSSSSVWTTTSTTS